MAEFDMYFTISQMVTFFSSLQKKTEGLLVVAFVTTWTGHDLVSSSHSIICAIILSWFSCEFSHHPVLKIVTYIHWTSSGKLFHRFSRQNFRQIDPMTKRRIIWAMQFESHMFTSPTESYYIPLYLHYIHMCYFNLEYSMPWCDYVKVESHIFPDVCLNPVQHIQFIHAIYMSFQ